MRDAEARLGVTATVGIGIPGVISPVTGLVKNANSIALNGHTFDRDISALLDREVRVENDANCFALSEAIDGAGAGSRRGVRRHPRHRLRRRCRGGRQGACAAATMSPANGATTRCRGRAPRSFQGGSAGAATSAVWRPGSPDRRWPATATARVRTTRPPFRLAPPPATQRAQAALDRHADRLARGLAHVVNLLDPDVIVLGGGLSNMDHLYAALPPLVTRYVFSDFVQTPIVPQQARRLHPACAARRGCGRQRESVLAFCRDCLTEVDGSRCAACSSTRIVSHPELFDLTIAHIDCDAFYASVEKRDRPELAARPVIVGGGVRGVVTAACYVARIYGVRSAMPMFKALKACPDAVVIRPDFAKYVAVGRQIRAMMATLTPLLQPLSIDEAVLDLAGTEALHGAPAAVVLARFAREVETTVGVTVSIGLAANRLLAKIAAGRDKPRGFAVIGAGRPRRCSRPSRSGCCPASALRSPANSPPRASRNLATFRR